MPWSLSKLIEMPFDHEIGCTDAFKTPKFIKIDPSRHSMGKNKLHTQFQVHQSWEAFTISKWSLFAKQIVLLSSKHQNLLSDTFRKWYGWVWSKLQVSGHWYTCNFGSNLLQIVLIVAQIIMIAKWVTSMHSHHLNCLKMTLILDIFRLRLFQFS